MNRDRYPVTRFEKRRGWVASLVQGVVIFSLLFAFFSLLGLGMAVAGYVYLAATLPSPDELVARTARFATTKIYDREGTLLYEFFDPQGGRRTVVPLSRISPFLIQATIATEDARFYQHPGFDPLGIARAFWQNLREKEIVSGASTIPQQLARLAFLSPERTLSRKLKEVVLASEISRRYSKQAILEMYLNSIYYGNLAYGVEAAAETYFGKSAAELTLAEAALLAGIPQSPALYDPFVHPEAAKARQKVVLGRMVEEGYISPAQAQAALAEELHFAPQEMEIKAPHFVMYVRELLEKRYGTDVLYRGGLRVYTTLDLRLQSLAERIAREHVARLKDRHVTNAALVAIRPQTGEILAMLGSVDFFDPSIDGQVNVALALRQPGSAIKPITYLAAFEKGWTPATLIWDLPTEFPDGANPPYKPTNYDDKFHGPVLVRVALGSSYNVPAVKTLQFVGIPAFLEMARRLGITTLTRPDYGLSLTLGGGEVSLLELTGAYAVLANGGRRIPPVAILRVEDSLGRLIEEYIPPPGEQVISPQHAYLITHILADNEARTPAFGPNSPLKLSRPAAAKTGTTNDWRDGWTIGYTPDLVVGVWVGNSDNSPMKRVPGVKGAGPIWHDFMEEALKDKPPVDFPRPDGIVEVEICALSGAKPSEVCPTRKKELFVAGTEPTDPGLDFHQKVRICRATGKRATEFCPPQLVEEKVFEVYPPEGREWALEHGIPQPPEEFCDLHTFAPRMAILQPTEGQEVRGTVEVLGHAFIPDFSHYVIEYGETHNPLGWGRVSGPHETPVDGGLLGYWDTTALHNGPHTLRVVAFDHQGLSYEARVRVYVANPTPTPTFTPTPTPTHTPTFTPAPSPTFTPVPSPMPTHTPTPLPTVTPSPRPQGTPTASPAG